MSGPQLEHDARRRLAGFLLSRGFRDRAAREAVLAALEAEVLNDQTVEPSQAVNAAVARFDAWQDALLDRVAPPDQQERRCAARQWLNTHLADQLRQHGGAFADPAPIADAARGALDAGDRACPPPLPRAHPQDMPRQPLGDLPAVLRGSFWVWTARWAWPQRLRRAQRRDAELLAGDDASGS